MTNTANYEFWYYIFILNCHTFNLIFSKMLTLGAFIEQLSTSDVQQNTIAMHKDEIEIGPPIQEQSKIF